MSILIIFSSQKLLQDLQNEGTYACLTVCAGCDGKVLNRRFRVGVVITVGLGCNQSGSRDVT